MTDFWKDVTELDRAAIEALIKDVREHQQADTLFVLTKGAEITIWKPKIVHGDLLVTLENEAGLMPRTAQRWVKAAKAFDGYFEHAALLHRQAVYDLSADSPWIPGVRNAVLERLREKDVPSLEEVSKLCKAAKQEFITTAPDKENHKSHNTIVEINNGADALFKLLKTQKAAVVKIMGSTHWNQIRKRLLELLNSA